MDCAPSKLLTNKFNIYQPSIEQMLTTHKTVQHLFNFNIVQDTQ